jgi:hypothetical protein
MPEASKWSFGLWKNRAYVDLPFMYSNAMYELHMGLKPSYF